MIRKRSEPKPSLGPHVVPPQEGGLTTFQGVFTPSILTILGVIMYLRLGWVVGNVGLPSTLLIITISTGITLLTGLSIAAISTDQRVRIGGAYYMISRSLGIETGGAVGIPLFLAQGLSVALYTVGFAESLVAVVPALDQRTTGVIVTILVAALALTSARAAIRAQYIIMAAIGLSLLSILFGGPVGPPDPQVVEDARVAGVNPEIRESFWTVFAVFFPAVTGIMAGVNLSGDLEEPSRSIPRGTFMAIGVGYLIYMTLPLLLAARADPETLIVDRLVMARTAFWGDAVLLGVWGATLSSAVGSILGAPRVLQALARDGVLPRGLRWLGRGSGPEDSPRVGTLFTLGIAVAAVWFGNLNVIAPVLTMFFLTTYGVLNVAAGVERLVGSPSFRPTFRVHWSLSLLGAVLCIAVMLVINPAATAVAAVFVLGVFLWIERRELRVAWGDVRRGIWLAVTRAGLMRTPRLADPKNWRPHLLVLSGSPTKRWHLIELASALSHNRALMTVATVVPARSFSPERQSKLEVSMRDFLARRGVQSLVRVVAAPNPFSGAERLVETYGLGALRPNTVLIGDTRDEKHVRRYARMIRFLHEAKRNVVLIRDDGRGFSARRRIDVWWGGLRGNGGLMMILAYLIQSSLQWRGVEVRVKMAVSHEDAARDTMANLRALIGEMRTGATPEVLVLGDRPFDEVLRESSASADLVLLGMADPDDDFASYYTSLRERTADLPTTMFVLSAEEVGHGEVLR
ncbi:MAG: Na-K-Cl cotransporter [Gemmatimonadota bacterium]|nr:Na-K-Cl cotransporter [Gemmatimonadota bacterium]